MIKLCMARLFSVIIVLQIRVTLGQNPFQCGVPQVTKRELIVLGNDTAPGDWPWHVALYHRDDLTESYACGGTLISEQFILTAAHCLLNTKNGYQLSKNRIFIRAGVHRRDALNSQTLQQHAVHRIHMFSTNFTREDLTNDIALLELDTVVKFNDYVQPACLNQKRDLTGEFGTVVGWGITEEGVISSPLKSAQMPAIDPINCLKSNRDLFGQTLDDGIFCAGYLNGTSVCNGDSGGGLFFKRNNVWYLGGIVSYSQKQLNSNLCYTFAYGAFTKVSKYLPWIKRITKLEFHLGEVLDFEDISVDFGRCDPVDVDRTKTYPNYLPRNCGIYNTNRILQGQKALVFEFPWMAIMRYRIPPEDELNYLCVGTLISNRYVLTAAHCVKSSMQPYQVRLGEHTIGQDRDCNANDEFGDCAPPVRDYGIQCIIQHQHYNRRLKSNNIALIRLNRNVVMEDHIQPICLPITMTLKASQMPRYIIAGWGDNEDDRKSLTLLKATVPVADRSKCQEWMDLVNLTLDEGQLCVGGAEMADACTGDGGGPLGYSAALNGMRFVQFGIVSFGSGCGNVPSIYTNVSNYMDWIIANMKP